MNDTEKFELRIYESGNRNVSFVLSSDIPFILPRVGDFINTSGIKAKKTPEQLLKVTKVTHYFFDNNSFMSRQTVNVETEMAS